ncbi:hypothetical protein A2U01_0071331 [Trifolium medium]|uniref:Uncharacterized protein n=1 Tax=Trifolium medium TaxID=97028 RepID=A0A392SNV0_9FABA|nr:hypothetical protein [Trifolium medium]
MQTFPDHPEEKGYDLVPKSGSPIRLLVEGLDKTILQTLHSLSSTPKDSGNLEGYFPRKR